MKDEKAAKTKWRWFAIFLLCLSLIYVFMIFETAMFVNHSKLVTVAGGKSIYNCPPKEEWFLAGKAKEYFYISCKPLTLNELGDFFAGSLSFIALVWASLGFFWQAREFSLQRNEYREGNLILSQTIDHYRETDERERYWQQEQKQLEELKFVSQKNEKIKFIAGYIYERYDSLATRPPKSHAAALEVIKACLSRNSGADDPSDVDLTKTWGDLDEIRTLIEYVVSSIEKNHIRDQIPISVQRLENYNVVLQLLNSSIPNKYGQ